MKFYLFNRDILKKDYHIDTSGEIWGYKFNKNLVHQVVTSYLSNTRKGSKSTKNFTDIRGGGIKPWKQKGTGRARVGTNRSSIWRGGVVSFSFKNKCNIIKKINKKMYILSLRSIISELVRNNRIFFISNFNISENKTYIITNMMKKNNINNLLIVVHYYNKNLFLACRNIPNVNVILYNFINPFSLIKYKNVIITLDAIKKMEEKLKK